MCVCACAACVQAGAGGVHEGADPLDSDRLLRQSALHQPHRSQDGRSGPVGRGVQGTYLSSPLNNISNDSFSTHVATLVLKDTSDAESIVSKSLKTEYDFTSK